jgi:hypothetical protein
LEYRSRFDGLTLELLRCKVTLPTLLSIMLFLRGIHGHYADIVAQFQSGHKSIELTTIDSVLLDVTFHDSFTLVEAKKGKAGGSSNSAPRIPAAAATNADRQGNVWQSPFEWLAKYGLKGIKGHWTRAMAGTGICPGCHCDEKPFHVPTQCPILPELGLKLIPCPPVKPSLVATAPASASPTPSPSPTPAPSGWSAATDSTPSTESATAPSGLAASVAPVDASAQEDYDTNEDFQWDGDESGPAFTGPPKLNKSVPLYSTPSCSHAQALLAHPGASAPRSISLPSRVTSILSKLSILSPCLPNGGHLAVADTGATEHMIPNKSSFISYHSVSGLNVRMGNNSYIPVLG